MAYGYNLTTTFLFVATLCVLLPQASAFGAGDIPDFAYLNEKAFRHGDIESILERLAKTAVKKSIDGTSLLGFAASVVSAASGPKTFTKNDIKKVYFGNWLRDYSQCMDIAGLSKLSGDTLVLIVSILGFMTFGYTTEEFEVTADRLGVYLPVEHIDNPKGYADTEPGDDARPYHSSLRPPVDERELEIDPETGMKNYMATENQGWDTSTGFIRRTFQACIEAGRRAGGEENAELWEAYRLLGTGLHTMEDLLAHSNWCEIALRKMGHSEVFCHVGDDVIVDTPNGPAPPLVTGTFGGADFLHSLLGEAGDKLSQASVTDLSSKMNEASQSTDSPDLGKLKSILSMLMGGGSEEEAKLDQGEELKQQAQGYHFDPNNSCPPEVMERLTATLKWHDDVMRSITKKIEMVPGLTDLLEEFSNALNTYIYTVIAPYVTPILTQTTSVLDEGSKAVIDNHDQYEVFNNPNASDPSHSMLSKDHFGLILNEPAGKIAQLLVENTVKLIVEAWSNDEDPNSVIEQILEAFHHPYYNTGRSQIQNRMFEEMEKWIGGLGPDEAEQTIQALTKESVRDHKNKRLGSEDQTFDEPGYGSCGHGHSGPSKYASPSYGGLGGGNHSHEQQHYESSHGEYAEQQPEQSYGGDRYGEQRQEEQHSYGGGRTYGEGNEGRDERQESSYEGGYGRREEQESGYTRDYSEGYGGGRRGDEYNEEVQESHEDSYGGSGHGRREREESHGYGDNEETFGAERLNISRDDGEEEQGNYYRRDEY